jgi:endonuclease YncB( thermonuclease family)
MLGESLLDLLQLNDLASGWNARVPMQATDVTFSVISGRARGEMKRVQTMQRRRIVLGLVLAVIMASPAVASTHSGKIDHVTDGDTIVLRGGEKIRLVQIDTPEVYFGKECYGSEASAETKNLLPPGTPVRITTDPKLDQKDRYGRTLAYVWNGSSLVNLRLVRDGVAAPYFFSGDEGEYAHLIFKSAVAARNAGKGLWGHCRKGAVPLRTNLGVATGPLVVAAPARIKTKSTVGAGCNANYSPCIPNSPSDLDCADVGRAVTIIGTDEYRLDADGDGSGCESYG